MWGELMNDQRKNSQQTALFTTRSNGDGKARLPTPISEIKSAPEQLFAKSRPCVKAKFLFIGQEKFYIRGVTYGTFRPDAHGNEYTSPDEVERDFAMMRASGINSV